MTQQSEIETVTGQAEPAQPKRWLIAAAAAPMAQELTGIGAMAAAGVVGTLSVANAVGRLCWAWLSDLVGRRLVFTAMLLLAAALRSLPLTSVVVGFTLLASVAMLCFGGGLGTMPAFAADYFGPKHVGPIMGLLMTAQGSAAMIGPMLLASARETSGSYGPALSTLALALALAAALPMALRPPGRPVAARGRIPAAAPVARFVLALAVFGLVMAGSSTGDVAYASDADVRQPAPGADLAVTLTTPSEHRMVGTLTYTATVTNHGPSGASNVRATVALPASDSFGSAQVPRGACSHTDQVVLCRLGSLARNESITVTVLVYPHWAGSNVVTARAVADESDLRPSNNSASVTMRPNGPARERFGPGFGPANCFRVQRLAPELPVAAWLRRTVASDALQSPDALPDELEDQPIGDGYRPELLAASCSPV